MSSAEERPDALDGSLDAAVKSFGDDGGAPGTVPPPHVPKVQARRRAPGGPLGALFVGVGNGAFGASPFARERGARDKPARGLQGRAEAPRALARTLTQPLASSPPVRAPHVAALRHPNPRSFWLYVGFGRRAAGALDALRRSSKTLIRLDLRKPRVWDLRRGARDSGVSPAVEQEEARCAGAAQQLCWERGRDSHEGLLARACDLSLCVRRWRLGCPHVCWRVKGALGRPLRLSGQTRS